MGPTAQNLPEGGAVGKAATVEPTGSSELTLNSIARGNFRQVVGTAWSTVGGMEVRTVGGRYAIDGRLGEGTNGQVYRARHLQLGKAFALKVISPTIALDGAARARFNEEAKLASAISHPNIVSVVDFGEDAQIGAYMVMELVEGEPLINEQAAPMSVRRACDVLGQIADALDHIHRRGIIHGDVKAENIMLTAEATGARRRRIARLLDFGLARLSSGDGEEQLNGSPHYLAPERAAGAPPSVAADIYALGVLGYVMLTAALPFDGSVVEILMAHINRDVPGLAQRRGEAVEPAVEQLILRALSKDPAKRHGSAAAFRAELNAAMDALEQGQRQPSGPIPVAHRRDPTLVAAFERSRVAQALLSLDGDIVFANKSFARLVGIESRVEGLNVGQTTLANMVPGFARALRAAHDSGQPCERRARVFRGSDAPALELTLWFAPLGVPGLEVHLLVRVEDADPRRRDE
ncbi:MAG: serine/threonine protein kinase [Deltaproteobacteria bacterium]|nr:MAG: serine/threonine protein kinase [Deltaproteobacteria bacterium]